MVTGSGGYASSVFKLCLKHSKSKGKKGGKYFSMECLVAGVIFIIREGLVVSKSVSPFHQRKCLVNKLTIEIVTCPHFGTDSSQISNHYKYFGLLSSMRIRFPRGLGHLVQIGT